MKEFLSREKVSYQEKNVAVDQKAAQEMVRKTGQMGVPVTVLAGQTIIGFNQPALKAAVAQLRRQQNQPPTSNDSPIKLGAQIADAYRLLGQSGALVGKVKPGSLAEQAGLREGDIITSLNHQPILNPDTLAACLGAIAANKVAKPLVIFQRGGAEQSSRLPLEFD